MKKYPKYKQSNLKWIDIIPERWITISINRLCRIGRGRVISEEELETGDLALYPVYSSQTFNDGIFGYLNTFDFEGEYATWTTDGANAGTVFYRNGKFNCTNVCGTLKPISKKTQLDLKLLTHVLNFATKSEVRQDINPKLMNNMMGAIKICIPSLPEQQSIVCFLDYKTGQIDNFIFNRQKQIELLKEQKAGIIKKAVTKGINPDAKMKSSGISWIGEIPEHWQLMKLKFAAKMMRGKFSHRPRNDERLYGGDYPFIQTGDVTKTEKYITTYNQTLNKWGYRVSKEFPKGTVVITIAANIGDVAILSFDACFPDSVVGFFSKKNLTEYLFYLLKSMKEVFLSESIEGTQLNLSVDRLSGIKIAIPELIEQEEILQHIKKESAIIDNLVNKYQLQLDLMTEYRTSLISQAVTGKIDVREWQPKEKGK